MSNSCSQVSLINTPKVSIGFIHFLENGEFNELLSNTPRRIYYNNLLSLEGTISVDETRNDVRHISEYCVDQQRTNDKPNEIDIWGGEETDDVCLEALNKYFWGEDFEDDEKMLLEVCIESSI